MKDKILQLCKRLNKFSLDEIETVSEMDSTGILSILNELISEKILIKKQDTYYHQKKNRDVSVKLPLMFQYHSNQDIDYIIKGFCTDVEVKKMMDIFGFGKNVAGNFVESVWGKFSSKNLKDKFRQNLLYCFLSNIGLELYRQWVFDNKQIPIEEVIKLSGELLCNGVNGFLKG